MNGEGLNTARENVPKKDPESNMYKPFYNNRNGVYAKLSELRVKLLSSELKKSGLNKFAGFQYFELSDFLPTVNKLFFEYKLSSSICFDKDSACLSIVDTEDNSSANFICPVVIPTMKGCNEIQALGAMMTYIRRYLYVNALEIVEHDAIDATSGQEGKGKGVIKPTDNELFQPDEKELEFLTEQLNAILAVKDNPIEAEKLIYQSGLDGDEQVWIINKLQPFSALRTAITKQHNSLKKVDY